MLINQRSAQPSRRGELMALLFFIFSVSDWFFSLMAFQMGVREGNPFLAWCQRYSLFTPVKCLLAVSATVLILALYRHRMARIVSYLGVIVMALLTSYHVVHLSVLLRR
jgi:hypothetical protein